MKHMVINRSTRTVLIAGLSQFDAHLHAKELKAAFPHFTFAVGLERN